MLISLVALAGCQNMSKPELAWQAMHFVDVAQTINGPANDPCFVEANPLTRSLIGENPSEESVLLWGMGVAFLHATASHMIEESDAPKWVEWAWHSVSLVTKGSTIIGNHNEGIRPFGRNINGCK